MVMNKQPTYFFRYLYFASNVINLQSWQSKGRKDRNYLKVLGFHD